MVRSNDEGRVGDHDVEEEVGEDVREDVGEAPGQPWVEISVCSVVSRGNSVDASEGSSGVLSAEADSPRTCRRIGRDVAFLMVRKVEKLCRDAWKAEDRVAVVRSNDLNIIRGGMVYG